MSYPTRAALPLILLGALGTAQADDIPDGPAAELGTIEVTGNADIYRNRLDTVSPVLSYDLSFFQRFEPLTVGDMLKRIPGVSFSSDVLEYDFPQFRGAGAEYTQVLINGRRVPGSGGDRSIQVDRIPAELVARVEVIRSPTAAIDSQGVAGTINIVLKKGAMLNNGTWRLGAQHFDDGEVKGLGFVSVNGQMDELSYNFGIDVQQRYNPKRKTEFHATPDSVLAYNQFERDTRDGLDTGFSGSLAWDLGSGSEFAVRGYYLDTERDEDELVDEVAVDPVAVAELEESAVTAGQLMSQGLQHEEISQQTGEFGFSYRDLLSGGTEMILDLGVATFSEETLVNEDELAYADEEAGADAPDADLDEIEQVRERIETDDTEIKLAADFIAGSGAHEFKYGAVLVSKTRDASLLIDERDYDAGDTPPAFETGEDQVADGRFELEEQRFDLYADDTLRLSEKAVLEYGLRAEYTRYEDADSGVSTDNTQINPSLHYRYAVSAADQFRVSVARTVRRPEFDELIPFTDVNEDFVETGNPELDPESSLGLDIGWEHRVSGEEGILGVNLFYRSISDKIEEVQIGDATGSEGDVVPLLQPRNLGDAKLYGIEFDSSLPLTFLGAPDFGVFANVTLLRSELTDPVSGETRDFNNQPELVYNLGFNHDLGSGWAYGTSYQKRGESLEVLEDERVELQYEGNLEAFLEKRFGDDLTLRLAGNNLLDAEKREDILGLDDGAIEKREVQLETAGPVYTLTLRGAF